MDQVKDGNETGNLPLRSRNAGATKNNLTLDKDGDEVRTEDLETAN